LLLPPVVKLIHSVTHTHTHIYTPTKERERRERKREKERERRTRNSAGVFTGCTAAVVKLCAG